MECLKIYPNNKINSVYFDYENLKNVWDNINGFGKRIKIRLRWYNQLLNKKYFGGKKNKSNDSKKCKIFRGF